MKIIGTGSAHPSFTLTNDMLASFLETSDEWITSRTGIKQRQVITDEELKDLAADAAKRALQNAGLSPRDIDFIICSNVVNEYATPSLACLVHEALDASCPSVDINAACTGFIYALQIAEAYQKAGMAKNILIVCAEEPTRMVDWNDRRTCVLFGDGAGAVVVTEGDNLKAIKTTNTSLTEVLVEKRVLEPTPFIKKEEVNKPLFMSGQEVFKNAVSSAARDIKDVVAKAGLQIADIDLFLLHQANMRIVEFVAHMLGEDKLKFPHNVENYGNTSSASIPMLLDELNAQGKLKNGQKLVLSAFGAGFTTGACVLEWATDKN